MTPIKFILWTHLFGNFPEHFSRILRNHCHWFSVIFSLNLATWLPSISCTKWLLNASLFEVKRNQLLWQLSLSILIYNSKEITHSSFRYLSLSSNSSIGLQYFIYLIQFFGHIYLIRVFYLHSIALKSKGNQFADVPPRWKLRNMRNAGAVWKSRWKVWKMADSQVSAN